MNRFNYSSITSWMESWTPAQILLRWNLQRGTVPLPKANRKDHQEKNLGAFDFELDEAHMDALDQLNEHYSSLGASLQYV